MTSPLTGAIPAVAPETWASYVIFERPRGQQLTEMGVLPVISSQALATVGDFASMNLQIFRLSKCDSDFFSSSFFCNLAFKGETLKFRFYPKCIYRQPTGYKEIWMKCRSNTSSKQLGGSICAARCEQRSHYLTY